MLHHPHEDAPPLDVEFTQWAAGADTSLGSLVHVFGRRAFALAFVVLLAPSALPIPTGGVTAIFEIAVMVLAIQLMIRPGDMWLPRRWKERQVDADGRMMQGILRFIRRVERVAKPRMTWLFGHRGGDMAFGALVLIGTLGSFLAPPFSGLDTLPALGVVLLSLGVIFRDVLIALAGLGVMAAGIALEIVLGRAAISAVQSFWPF